MYKNNAITNVSLQDPATLMEVGVSAPIRNVIPIPGPDNPDRIYLELLPDVDRGTVLVRPGPSGRRLPSFWSTWVRELIMFELAKPHTTYRVSLLGGRVVVSSPNGFGKALEMAQLAASKVHQLPACPLVPIQQRSPGVSRRWRIDGMEEWIMKVPQEDCHMHDSSQLSVFHDKALATAASISLPRGMRIEVSDSYERVRGEFVSCVTVILHRDTNSSLRLGGVAERVKLAYTLARASADASPLAA